jgi:hypothetical protein
VAGHESSDRFPDNAEADGSIPSSPTKSLVKGHFLVAQKPAELSKMVPLANFVTPPTNGWSGQVHDEQ